MIDLSTTYLGLKLKNLIVASASPLSKKIEQVKRMEEAGVSAVVMYSLFEEQIIHESLELDHYLAHAVRSRSPRRSPIFPMPALTAYCRIDMWRMSKFKEGRQYSRDRKPETESPKAAGHAMLTSFKMPERTRLN